MTGAAVDCKAPTRKRGLAWVALTCGLVAFCFPPAALLAAILGAVAIHRATRRRDEFAGRRLATAALLLGVMGVLFFFLWLVPQWRHARALSLQVVCASSLKGVGASLLIYHEEHPDAPLPEIEELVARGDVVPTQLWCPITEQPHVFLRLTAEQLGDAETVWAYEPRGSHGVDTGIVLFADGHVEVLDGKAFERVIAGVQP